jgi:hypothetical protein
LSPGTPLAIAGLVVARETLVLSSTTVRFGKPRGRPATSSASSWEPMADDRTHPNFTGPRRTQRAGIGPGTFGALLLATR